MQRVRRRDTAPELLLRTALWQSGCRYRLRAPYKLPGKPDIVFTRARLAVFVDGCFWHTCPLHGSRPKTNVEFWTPKLDQNRQRDADVNQRLAKLGWRVLRFWEHEVEEDAKACVLSVRRALRMPVS